jgi:peroxiredoxin
MLTQILSHLIIALYIVPSGILNGYQVGDTVDSFTLPSVKGSEVALSDFNDQKGVILIFDCNTCPYSQAYRDRIKALHAKYSNQGFPVVAINPNDPVRQPGDSFDKMKAYAAEHGYTHHYLQDVGQDVTRAFGATNTPHVFVLENVSGKFTVRYIGAIDNNTRSASAADKKYVENAVDALLAGSAPDVTKTKAIGCSIKWKAS